ncbi:MAG: hypothetical protein Q7I92_15895 [Humidesulfovibrio sp.]|nr:hypothetical protein [Humidesulfovibrio sp.]
MARLGSFAAPVDLPDHLRPWRAAGLDSLFLPDGLPVFSPAAISGVPAAAPVAGDHPAAAQAKPFDGATSPESPTPPIDNDWPEPWRAIASRLRSKPQIIITYASLTADVTGQADPARRKLFQTILGYMGWPQGTSLFWPCTDVPELPGLARNIFLNGALSFGVTHIACFGADAAHIATALFPPGPADTEIRVFSLPEPSELIGLLPHELHRAVAALKALTLE